MATQSCQSSQIVQTQVKRARRLPGEIMPIVSAEQGAAVAKAAATPTGGRRLPRPGDVRRMDEEEDVGGAAVGPNRHQQNIQLLNKAVPQAHQIRELNGLTLQTYLVPHDSPPVTATLQAGVSYD